MAAATAAAAAGVVHSGAFTFQTQSTGTHRPSVGGAGAAGAGAGTGSFVDLQLLSNSACSDGVGGGGESPAAARSHHKGGSGGGSFGSEGEEWEWSIGRVPSGVSRWAGLGVVEKLEVSESGACVTGRVRRAEREEGAVCCFEVGVCVALVLSGML